MTTKEIKALDILWSLIIKEKYNYKCVNCGKNEHLNSHHIITRHNKSTRWLYQNGICLCAGCHTFSNDSIHANPILWEGKLIEMNIDKQLLLMESKHIIKYTFGEILEYLTKICNYSNHTDSLEKAIEIKNNYTRGKYDRKRRTALKRHRRAKHIAKENNGGKKNKGYSKKVQSDNETN
jgi:hypothetical protein